MRSQNRHRAWWHSYHLFGISFWLLLGLGTILRPWAPSLPHVAKVSILDDFRGIDSPPQGIDFSSLGVTISMSGASEAEDRCFLGHLVSRSDFGMLSDEILGCLGWLKLGFSLQMVVCNSLQANGWSARQWFTVDQNRYYAWSKPNGPWQVMQ